MKQLVAFSALLMTLAVSSCAESAKEKEVVTVEQKEEQVKMLEDSLKKGLIDPRTQANVDVRYAESCLGVYRAARKSEKAPAYLDKAHMIYSSSGMHRLAVMYADTLIQQYPNYKNRPMVLLSLASAYDMFILPRRKDLVKKYYEMLLTENPDLPKDEADGYRFRLENIDKTYDELIDLQAQKAVNQ